MDNTLHSLVGYNAWANKELLDTLDGVDPTAHATELEAAIRLLNHSHIVGRIFAGHLTGRPHGYTASNTIETPTLAALRADLTACDRWYLDYVRSLSPSAAAERIAFTFTDSDKGLMSRAEMVTHMTIHGGYHRGEIGRILKQLQLQISLPWDTFAVYLHQSDPARRQGEAAVA